MTKQTAKIDAQLAEAKEAKEQAVALEEQARQAYQDALAAGDMAAADVATAEAERQVRAAGIARDRVEVLEEQRIEAEAEDAKPGYRQAVEVMQAALDSEKAAHDELAALVRQVAEVRSRLPALHNGANAAIQAACKAAVAAHEDAPDFRHRSSLTAYPEVSKLMGTARELLNVAAHQAQLIHAANHPR